MEMFPVSILFILLLTMNLRKGSSRAFMFTIAMLPFGMASFANLTLVGNLALQLAHVGAASIICLVLLKKYLRWAKYRHRIDTIGILRTLNLEEMALVLFTIYSVFSAVFFVRIFSGEFYVFPMRLDIDGRIVGPFISRITELTPSSSNISQSFYIVLGVCFYFISRIVIDREGRSVAHRALVTSAVLNIVLGLLDYLGFDGILGFFRTASYSLLNTHELAGMGRIVGGFPEPAAFGSFSVSMGVYFLVYFIRVGGIRSGILAFSSLLLAMSSLSTTAYVGVGCAALLLFSGLFIQIVKNRIPVRTIVLVLVCTFIVLTIMFVFVLTDIPSMIQDVFYSLFISKSESNSALERGAWASFALQAFAETYMLGAGVGSLRGNGWVSVYLGSVGIVGSLLLLFFLFRILLIERHGERLNNIRKIDLDCIVAARASAVTMVAMACISATTTSLGLLLMLFCALTSLGTRDVMRQDSIRIQRRSDYLKSYYGG